MALAVSSLDNGGVGANAATTITTSSVSPQANALLMIWLVSVKTGGLTVSSISGFATWSKVTSKVVSSSTGIELWTCQLGTSPGSGTVTVTFSGSASASEGYDLWQVTGHNTATPLITGNTKTAGAASGVNPAITFNAAAAAVNRFAFGVAAAGATAETPAANYAELTDATYASPSVSLETQVSADATNISAGATPAVNNITGAIGVEINAAVAAVSLDHGGVSGNAGTTMTTNSVTPAGNALLAIWVASVKTGGLTVSSISGFATWSKVTSIAASSSTAIELWICQLGASPGTAAVTVTFSGAASATEGYDLWQVTGHDTAAPLVTGNTRAAAFASGVSPAITFAGAALTGNRFAFGVVANSFLTETPAAGYAELTDNAYSGPSVSLETQTADYTTPAAGATPSLAALTAAIGVELNSAGKTISGAAAQVKVRAPGGDAYDTAVLGDGPVVFWKNTTGVDATGNGHTLAAFNSPGSGILPNGDRAYVFNGTTQYCETPDADSLSVLVAATGGTGTGTYEAWIRPDVLTFPVEEGEGYVHWGGKGTSGQQEFVHRMYGADNSVGRENRISGYSFNLSGGIGNGAYWETPGGEVAGVWLHYVLVINYVNTSPTWPSGYVTIYRNGVNTNTQTLAGITPGNGTAPLRLGTRDFSSYFEGGIGKYAIYNYELSQARVTAHYNAMITGSSGSAGPFAGGPGVFKGTFGGPETFIYPNYIDVQAGHTLVASPGGTYQVMPAGEAAHPELPGLPGDGHWVPS